MTQKPTIGICAPSSYARLDRLEKGIKKLQDWGHRLIIHPQTYGRLGQTQLAGTTDEKLSALYDLFRNLDVDIIMPTGGGNGAIHLLDKMDFSICAAHPKPMIGFSDATILINTIASRTGQTTYHGPMVTTFGWDGFDAPENYDDMMGVITKNRTSIPLAGANGSFRHAVTGRIYGGNLECFRALVGTPYLPDIDGALLLLEDIGLELNHLDRTLCSLKLAGVFDRAAGLIFGGFTDMLDTGRPFGFTADDIIAAHTSHLNKPVITHAPFGHVFHNTTIPIGAMATLDLDQGVPHLFLDKQP